MKIELHHGDCLEVMKDIPDNSVDLVLTDPPYGTTACKWDVVIPFESMWEQIKRIRKERCAVVLFGSEPFSSYLRMSNIKEFKYDWIWDKKKPVGAHVSKIRPLQQTEIISKFFVSNYFPIKTIRGKQLIGGKEYGRTSIVGGKINKDKNKNRIIKDYNPRNLIQFSNADNTNRKHPTQKPVKLLEYLIKTYTLESQTVLDFTMGSGSTGVACKNLDRNFIGIEKDDQYFQIAKDSIENHVVQERLFR